MEFIKKKKVKKEVEWIELRHVDLYKVIEAVGGLDNIIEVSSCITRLRLELKNYSFVNTHGLNALGARGIVKLDNGIQIIYGNESKRLADEITKIKKDIGK